MWATAEFEATMKGRTFSPARNWTPIPRSPDHTPQSLHRVYLPFILRFSQSVSQPVSPQATHHSTLPTVHYHTVAVATQQVSNYFVALSAVTINRNGRSDVSLQQHTVKPQPRLQISPPVAPRASPISMELHRWSSYRSLPLCPHVQCWQGGSNGACALRVWFWHYHVC